MEYQFEKGGKYQVWYKFFGTVWHKYSYYQMRGIRVDNLTSIESNTAIVNVPKIITYNSTYGIVSEQDRVYYIPKAEGARCTPELAVNSVRVNTEPFNFTTVGEFYTCYKYSKYNFVDEYVLYTAPELTVTVYDTPDLSVGPLYLITHQESRITITGKGVSPRDTATLSVVCPPVENRPFIDLPLQSAGDLKDKVYADVTVNYEEKEFKVCYKYEYTDTYLEISGTIHMVLLTGILPEEAVAGRNNSMILEGMELLTGDEVKLIKKGEDCKNDEGIYSVVKDKRAVMFFPEEGETYHACYRYNTVSNEWYSYEWIKVNTVALTVTSVTPNFAFVEHEVTVTIGGQGVATSCVKFVPYGSGCSREMGDEYYKTISADGNFTVLLDPNRYSLCFSFQCTDAYEMIRDLEFSVVGLTSVEPTLLNAYEITTLKLNGTGITYGDAVKMIGMEEDCTEGALYSPLVVSRDMTVAVYPIVGGEKKLCIEMLVYGNKVWHEADHLPILVRDILPGEHVAIKGVEHVFNVTGTIGAVLNRGDQILFTTSEAVVDSDCMSYAVNERICEVEEDGTFKMTFLEAGFGFKMCVKFSGSNSFVLARNVTVDVLHLESVSRPMSVAGTMNTLTVEGVGLAAGDRLAVVPVGNSCPTDLNSYFEVTGEETLTADVIVPTALNVTYKVCYKFDRYTTPIAYDYFLSVLDVVAMTSETIVRRVPVMVTYSGPGIGNVNYEVSALDQSAWTAGEFTSLVSEGQARLVTMPVSFTVTMSETKFVEEIALRVIPGAAGQVLPRPSIAVSYMFHGYEIEAECMVTDEENVLTASCLPFATDNMKVTLTSESTENYAVSQFLVKGSNLEDNAFVYYLPDSEDVDCTQDPPEFYPVSLATGEALLVFSEFGAMKACFRFGGSLYVERRSVRADVNFAYVADVLVSTVVVGDTESKEVTFSGLGMSEYDEFKVVYESCSEPAVANMEANVDKHGDKFVARVRLDSSDYDTVHLCYRFSSSKYYLVPQILPEAEEIPFTMSVKDVKTFEGMPGFGTAMLVSVTKQYVVGGFGISDQDNVVFRKNSCDNLESSFNVFSGKVEVQIDEPGVYYMCYRFNGEHFVMFPSHSIRVAQVISVEPRYVVINEENEVEMRGATLIADDKFGFTQSASSTCVMVSSELNEDLVTLVHTFNGLGEFKMCVKLDGDNTPYVVSNVVITVLASHEVELVEHTTFPVTTIEERDKHTVTIHSKTVHKDDKVKFVKESCDEDAVVYSVTCGDLKANVEAVFSEKVPQLHVCYKFRKLSDYIMTNFTITLLYVESVEPEYVIREVDSLLWFTGEGLSNGRVRLAKNDLCTEKVSDEAIHENLEGLYAEMNVADMDSTVYLCVKYSAYNENYHYTGHILEVYGLEEVSVSKWLVNLSLPSSESINTEGLILTGRGLDQADVKLVRSNRDCMALGTLLTVALMNGTELNKFVAEPFVIEQPGDYRFCVRFGESRFVSYDHIPFTVEAYNVGIEDSTGLVSLVKGDEDTSKNVTFTGAVEYYREMEVKLVDGENCNAEPVTSIEVNVMGHVAELTATSGLESPLRFCVKTEDSWHYMSSFQLYVKELTEVALGDEKDVLKVTDGRYVVTLSGFHVGAGDMLKYVPVGDDCSVASVLTYAIGSSHSAELLIQSTLSESAYELCYRFSGESVYMKYPSKTLNVYLIASIQPDYMVAYQPTDLVITGLGRALGDKLWFVSEECGAVPEDAVEVTSLNSVTVTITNPSVQYMCYNFVGYGTVKVSAIPVVVYSVSAMSHSSWLSNVALPTAGFTTPEGVNTALVLTGTHFSLDNRVKFVKSSTSCSEGVSTNPIQMNTVSVDGTSATLMTVEFPEAGEYYLCIVHHVA